MEKIKDDILKCRDILKKMDENYVPVDQVMIARLRQLQAEYSYLFRNKSETEMGTLTDELQQIKDAYHPRLDTYFKISPWWRYYILCVTKVELAVKQADMSNKPYESMDFQDGCPTDISFDHYEQLFRTMPLPLLSLPEAFFNEPMAMETVTDLRRLGLDPCSKCSDSFLKDKKRDPCSKCSDSSMKEKMSTMTGMMHFFAKDYQQCVVCDTRLEGYTYRTLTNNYKVQECPCLMPPAHCEDTLKFVCSTDCAKMKIAMSSKNYKRHGTYVHQLWNDFKACKFCFNPMEERKVCSKCRAMYYCSKECQAKDWPEHKTYCKKMKDHKVEASADVCTSH